MSGFFRLSFRIFLFLVFLAASSCGGLPKRGNDSAKIRLGYPRVAARERYINDRISDLAWLRNELETSTNYDQGLQGGVLSRIFDRARSDVTLKANLVAALETRIPEVTSSAGQGDQGEGASSKPQLSQEQLDSFLKLLEENEKVNAPSLSPVDRLDSRLAYRDAVHSAIRQRALDDTHDLFGNTLHELTFDLSLFPGNDSGDPYVVVVDVETDEALRDETIKGLLRSMRENALSESNTRTMRLIDGPTTGDLDWLIRIERYANLETQARQNIEVHKRIVEFLSAPDLVTAGTSCEPLSFDDIRDVRKCMYSGYGDETATALLSKRIKDDTAKLIDFVSDSLTEERARRVIAYRTRAQPDTGAAPKTAMRDLSAEETAYVNEFLKNYGNYNNEDQQQSSGIEPAVVSNPEGNPVASVNAPAMFSLNTTTTPLVDLIGPESDDAWNEYTASLRSLLDGTLGSLPRTDIQLFLSALDVGRELERESCEAIKLLEVQQFSLLEGEKRRVGYLPLLEIARDTDGFKACISAKNKYKTAGGSHAIAVTPSEQVEVFGVDLGSLMQREFSTNINALLSDSVDGRLESERIRQEVLRIAQLEQNPLIVGFVGAGSSAPSGQGASSFGWLLAPNLEARQPQAPALGEFLPTPGVQEWYRHRAIHHPVTATIVTLAETDSIKLTVRVYRILEDGSWVIATDALGPVEVPPNTAKCILLNDEVVTFPVELPVDGSAFARGLMNGNDRSTGAPSVIASQPRALDSGKSGSLLVLGKNLWRNPEVYVGGVKASVQTTADLDGIHASFSDVNLPSGKYDLTVVTSAGRDIRENYIEVLDGLRAAYLASRKSSPIQADGHLTISFVLPKSLEGWSDVKVRLRTPQNTILYDGPVESLRLLDKGHRVETTIKIPLAKLDNAAGDYEVDLYILPSPMDDYIGITKNQTLTHVSHAWLAKMRVGTDVVTETVNERTVIKQGAEIKFEFGEVSWSQVSEAWKGVKIEEINKALDGIAEIESAKIVEPGILVLIPNEDINPSLSIRLELLGGVELNLTMSD